tara:strand:- start:725 stop:2413 length:1689 start_codon:yes stop_codon:yes gene_type:complete
MAKQEIKLQKKVISPKKANSDFNKDFKEVSQSPKPINNDYIIDTYKEVFYNISKKGKLSHESIIERSHNFLYPERASIIEAKIETRQAKLGLLNDRLFKLSSPNVKEHPVYPDGTFLKVNSPNTIGSNVQNPYIMQDGLKRYFAADYLFNIVRKAMGQNEDDFQTDVIHLSLQDIIQIPDGEVIRTGKDLNKEDIDTIDRIEDIPSDNLIISCVGREQTDYVNNIVSPTNVNYSINLNEDCSLLVAEAYYDDDGLTLLSRVKEIKIPAAGDWREANYVHTGSPISVPMSTVPEMIEPAYGDYYSNWANKEPYSSLVFEDRDKIWGKFADGTYRKFPAIIKAVGRMYYKEKSDGNSKLLNGVENDYLPDVPNHDGSTKSDYNTSMIYKDCKNRFGQIRSFCFGDLKQEDRIQDYFNSSDSNYYKKTAKKSITYAGYEIAKIEGDVYGQPIFQHPDAGEIVLLGVRYIEFKVFGQLIFEGSAIAYLNLRKYDKDDVKIEFNKEQFLGVDITKDKYFDYKSVDSKYIRYLGLQGHSLNHGNSFKYNPNGENGTNDGLTDYMKQWL